MIITGSGTNEGVNDMIKSIIYSPHEGCISLLVSRSCLAGVADLYVTDLIRL